ncbi:MAG: hypothetical protein L0Z62_29235 [Gemmataceae bacterium]|nr:hypothetical protein [Gemmataceae bacterium]
MSRSAFAAQADPAAHASDFALRNADAFERIVQQRMRDVGVPDHLIGDTPLGGGVRRAFLPQEGTGGGVTVGAGINVDSGVLNPELLGDPAAGGAAQVWSRARLRDRIDAVIAHEYEECLRGTDAAARQHAPTTSLRISDEARAILRHMAGSNP